MKVYGIRLSSLKDPRIPAEVTFCRADREINIIVENASGISFKVKSQATQITINGQAFSVSKCNKKMHFDLRGEKPRKRLLPLKPGEKFMGYGMIDVFLDPVRIYVPSGAAEPAQKAAAVFSSPRTAGYIPEQDVSYPIIDRIKKTDNNFSMIVFDHNSNDRLCRRVRSKATIKTDENGYEYCGRYTEGKYLIMQIMPWRHKQSLLYINTNSLDFYEEHFLFRNLVLPTYPSGRHPYLNALALIFDGEKTKVINEYGTPAADPLG